MGGRAQRTWGLPSLRLRGGGGAPKNQGADKGGGKKRAEVPQQTDEELIEEVKKLIDECNAGLDDVQYMLDFHGENCESMLLAKIIVSHLFMAQSKRMQMVN
jgi:hypothetical protein